MRPSAPTAIRTLLLASLALSAAAQAAEPAPAAAQTAQAATEPLFAEVNGRTISAREYESTVQNMARQKFYHGKPPEAQVQALRQEVADRLVERVLLLEEIGRRDLRADDQAIAATLAEYDQRYGNSAHWQQNRERMLPGLTAKLREQQLLQRIEAQVRDVPAGTPAEVRAYYDAHPELFTEPEKLRLSVILLKVDPSSPGSAWDKAMEEAAAIRKRILAGADFGELARLHSGDGTAAQDGDMGYLHRGMLPEGLHEQVDKIQPGQLSEPVRVLEGIALFRLADRKAANKRGFEEVAGRAAELLGRERSEQSWKGFLDGLRAAARIRIDTQRYPFLKTAHAGTR